MLLGLFGVDCVIVYDVVLMMIVKVVNVYCV